MFFVPALAIDAVSVANFKTISDVSPTIAKKAYAGASPMDGVYARKRSCPPFEY
jgi:hypothetical protein